MIRILIGTLTLFAVTLPLLSQAKEGADWFAALKDAQSADDCDDGLRHLDVGRQESEIAIEIIKRIDGKDGRRANELHQKNIGRHRLGAMMIGLIMARGTCELYEPSQAFDLYLEAAALGSTSAKFLLAKSYLKGLGSPPNETKARYWLKSIALASILYPKKYRWESMVSHITIDDQLKTALLEEFSWMESLAAQSPEKRMAVVHLLRDGVGVPRDLETAYYWLDKVADDGLIEAKYELADWAIENRLPLDMLGSKSKFLESAANAGYVKAMVDLARRSEIGDGVFKDLYDAYFWLLRARLNGIDVTSAINRVLPQLSEKAKSRAHFMVYRLYH